MRKTLRKNLRSFTLLKGSGNDPETALTRFDGKSSALAFLRQFLFDHFNMTSLRDFLAEEFHCRDLSRMSDQEVLEDLACRLVSGQAGIAESPRKEPAFSSGGGREIEPEPPSPTGGSSVAPPKVEEKTSWIEIELVGEDGEGVPGEKYRIKLPDGSTKEGSLDKDGFARFECSKEGTCKVCFPDIDLEAWELIG